ncbi:Ligand-binding domain of nuclear hormone receptor [Oesophagostomum dentatum]|uniref:Ligand-binding domain of nuclear hormone receptor n=1 Tax=Oesophagostomum dentatum TaxID=61180 RepID=A0A0B1TC00_OESDE|nr:Ligand-binding domain of nuclear hormone receptor [Oesophagostomum dentatum]
MQPCSSRCCTPDSPELFRTRHCHKDLNERINRLRTVEDRLGYLRCSSYSFSSNLVEIITSPSLLEKEENCKPGMCSNVTSWDEEFSIQVEYAKSFPWFREMQIEDQLLILVDRLLYVSALRIANGASKLLQTDLTSNSLRSTVSAVQRAELDPVAFAILNAIIFTDYGASHLSESSCALLKEERSKYLDALRLHLFKKHPSSGAAHFLNHLAILWSLQGDCCILRKNLLNTLSPSSLTLRILSVEL